MYTCRHAHIKNTNKLASVRKTDVKKNGFLTARITIRPECSGMVCQLLREKKKIRFCTGKNR